MCGIAGHVAHGSNGHVDHEVLGALGHRGPDAHRTQNCSTAECSWELAFARLSIIDLSTAGEQPMSNPDGSLVMVFNGEIYNSPELRRHCEERGHRFRSTMDGEVILHLWEMEGVACLARLNGIFALAVASTSTGELTIARDPVGVKPLFHTIDAEGGLWFASELKALRAAGAPMGSHDVVALAQFLTFLWVPDPRTPYDGVRSLEPGTAMRWTKDGATSFRYCPELVPEVEPARIAPQDAIDECSRRINDAVARQLLADVPIGLMASGGVDSGLIWAAAPDGLKAAFTVTWPGEEGREGLNDDTDAVRQLEKRFGTRVIYIPGADSDDAPPLSGDLFADPAQGLAGLVARYARDDGYKVLMAGQGGDELFAGYRRHRMAATLARLRLGRVGSLAARATLAAGSQRIGLEYATRMLRALAQADPFRGYMTLCSYSSAADRARALGCTEAEVADDIVWDRHRQVYESLPSELSLLRKVMAVDLAVYLPGLGLAYVDRAGMQYGVEVRVPLLDLELVRWSLTLPDNLLIHGRQGKFLPKQVAARRLSDHLANRPKRGFAAPAERVGQSGAGRAGFRQGSYFGRAAAILDEFAGDGAIGSAKPTPAAIATRP